ncbi:MAG: NlpC/P60 family protein [Hamadaea sp.]|uniref:C40 family peptidase n=1 Tax=Hamadaea sp. TaxID=2024425 RepID=UPI0017F7F85B|nr:C40 family peptidase [Hamadaea sp.]NUR72309.1 NlpC/P60 family protein [Hamadaea sp.]NUT18715.1 NlpC/P60 family protein [Hamadaea sp.]
MHRLLRAILTLTALVAATIGLGGPAAAAPSVAELERQIDAAWNKLEPIIEQYDMIHGQLTANRAKVATLNKQLGPLELQIHLSAAGLNDAAATMYMGGQMSRLNALLSAPDPGDFADKMTTLELLAQSERQQIAGVVVMRDKYAADKARLDALVAELAGQDTALAAQKKTIEKQISALQKLRQQVYGSSGAVGKLKPVACPVDYLGGPGGTAAKKACSLIGKPYIWGAAGPSGYDCSGLTLTAWKAAGVTLRHYTKWQWEDNKPVSRADLRPGDLVFFFSDLHHMGIYVGGGWMVHAPTTGDFVRMAKIDSAYLPIAGYRRVPV